MTNSAQAIGKGLARAGVGEREPRRLIASIALAQFQTTEARDKLYNAAIVAYTNTGAPQ